MDFIELSIEETKQQTIELAQQIEQKLQPDVIVFIAKGAYIIGCELARYFDVPVVEVFAKRKGNVIKQLFAPLLVVLPTRWKLALRKKELTSALHKNTTRDVEIYSGQQLLLQAETIVVVDDSVDTGATMKEVVAFVQRLAPQAHIQTAALNVFDNSKAIIPVSYSLHENTILIGPWSKDSLYYTSFQTNYAELKRIGVF